MDLAEFIFKTRLEFPGFTIKTKGSSLLMKVVAALLLVLTLGAQRRFMSEYITTIGRTVYVPNDWNTWADSRKLAVLRHERIHMAQAKRYGFLLFSLMYIFLPLPLGLAYCRARFEWEAYEESMRAHADLYGRRILDDVRYRDSIVRQFTTGAYGWMWPFRNTVEGWYEKSKNKILTEKFYAER